MTAVDDGYDGGEFIDCTECGHTIELQHDTTGCEGSLDEPCDCPARWTVKEIMALRRSHGLPDDWRRR